MPKAARPVTGNTIRGLRNWLDHEYESAIEFTEMARGTSDGRLRALYRQIAIDSLNHADLLSSVLTALAGSSEEVAGMSGEERSTLLRHIEEEKKVIGLAQSLSSKVADETLSILLGKIVDDEKRHHAALKRASEAPV